MAPRKKNSSIKVPNVTTYPSGVNNNVTVDNFFDKEWRDYVVYTISNRAIPSVIDGLKPGQRKAVYCARKINKLIKVTGLTGSTMTDGNYHHGDASMNDAIVGLAAPFNNNVPLLHGDGVFGSRLIRDAGAPRYISVKLADSFYTYFNDFHIMPPSDDPEDPEPKFYLPVIPWVLVNGVTGIATAYATDIPRYHPQDIAKLCKQYVTGKSIDKYELLPFYEGFSGSFAYASPGKLVCNGKVNKIDATTIEILEIPLMYDHPTYIKLLQRLKETDVIVKYIDESKDGKFKFTVTLKRSGPSIGRGAVLTDDQIIKTFRLSSNIKQNINVLDENNRLMNFESPIGVIKYFCDFRLKTVGDRITANLAKTQSEIERITERLKFIKLVVDGKIVFKQKSKSEIIDQMIKNKLNNKYFDYLLDIKIYNLTTDSINAANDKLIELKTEEVYWTNTTAVAEFTKDLDKLI